MASLSDLHSKLDEYESTYRSSSLSGFSRSKLYDLFPRESGQAAGVGLEWSRQESWPYSSKAGVYAVLDSGLNVLYIGEAGMLGRRLSDYFKYAGDGSCRVVDTWTERPRYVMSIAVESDTDFERFSLEKFLIRELDPPDNIQGRISRGA